MITALAVLACVAFMLVGAWLGKRHDVEKSNRELDNIRHNLHHYAVCFPDDIHFWVRYGGLRCADQVTKVLDKINGRK